jgi:hypothetical protein
MGYFFGLHNLKTFRLIMGVWCAKKEIDGKQYYFNGNVTLLR